MTTEEKDIYAIGEIPPLGFVPKKMHAWVIRRDRHGNPMQSFKEEVVIEVVSKTFFSSLK